MSTKKLNLAIITSTYARHDTDPQVPWMRETVKQLAAKGHKVTILAASHKDVQEDEIDGIKVLRFRYAPKKLEVLTHDEGASNKIGSPLIKLLILPYLLFGALQVLYWCYKYKFQVLNIHWPVPHYLLALLPKILLGTKTVNTYHGAGLALCRNSKALRTIFASKIFKADGETANSSHTQSELSRLLSAEAKVIPYGSTVEIKQQAKKTESAEKVILFSGRNIERKGVPYLIKALPLILREEKVKLIITGTGNKHEEWKQLVKEKNLEMFVEFAGFVSNEKLAELYYQADVYCLPAIFDSKGDTEGLGVVLIEALSYQKPVIASKVGGIVDVIKHGQTGLLVPEKDEVALANSILKVLANPEYAKELGRSGAEHVKQVFNWKRVLNLFEDSFFLSLDSKYVRRASMRSYYKQTPSSYKSNPSLPSAYFKNLESKSKNLGGFFYE